MWTFSKLWGITHPEEAKEIIKKQSEHIKNITNLEEQAINLVGSEIYEKLIKGYTEKQWKKSAKDLPKEIIKRLPVRFVYDNNYFNDKYQGIPIGGYTKIFEKLLENIEVKLSIDFLKEKEYWQTQADKIIYTGAIDRYFNYCFGELEYKTTTFEHKKLDIENYQGVAMMNYTDIEIPFTRCIEHKHFENSDSPVTWITYEYPEIYKSEISEPYYPVNDYTNNQKYENYKTLINYEKNVYFGGRLAEYKYYDMHQVIESALKFINSI
jgi:UDP-galactopyranose mutase